MRRLALGLLATLLAPMVAAQERDEYDTRVLTGCLIETHPSDAQRCIGLGAAHCMTANSMQSNFGITYCYNSEAQDWDSRLNLVYRVLLQDQEKLASENTDVVSGLPNAVDVLREMQRYWMAYRDAACTFETVQWGGGTGGGPASAQCLMELTAQQTLRLERYLQ